jgi:hypothetical protein
MSFADQLTAAIQRLWLTQPEAAALLGIKPRTLWDWLHGVVTPHRYMQKGALAELAGRAAGAGGAVPAPKRRSKGNNSRSPATLGRKP